MKFQLRNKIPKPLSFKELDDNFIMLMVQIFSLWATNVDSGVEDIQIANGATINEVEFNGGRLSLNEKGQPYQIFVIHNSTNSDIKIDTGNNYGGPVFAFSKNENIAPAFLFYFETAVFQNPNLVIVMANNPFVVSETDINELRNKE